MGMTQLLDQWVKEGREQGVEQGESNKQKAVISNARLKLKMSMNKIATLVNLMPTIVRQILDEMVLNNFYSSNCFNS